MREADLPDGSDALRRLRPLQLHALLQARQYVRAFEAKKLAEASEQWNRVLHTLPIYSIYVCCEIGIQI